jgi:hypothetical protein
MAKKVLTLETLARKNSWNPVEAAFWANIPLRTFYDMLRQGAIPVLPMGNRQDQKYPRARSGKRRRACFRYVIPAKAFMRWFESLSAPGAGSGSGGKTAA